MARVHIISRPKTKAGKHRFVVRYRVGGRETPLQEAGTFSDTSKTRALDMARARARVIEDSLARGVLPDLDLATAHQARRTMIQAAGEYVASRVDATENTLKVYRQAISTLGPLGSVLTDRVTIEDVQAWVRVTSETRKPATVRKYLDLIRCTLDFTGREHQDNPARSRHIRIGKSEREEINPPGFDHVMAMLASVTPRYRLHLEVLEATGLRISELLAITWGRMDFRRGGLLVAHGATKGNTSGRRFVPLPDHLVDQIGALVPVEDRGASTPVFDGTDQAVRLAMARACKFAQIPHYSPHDFRHRWISLRYAAGWPETNIAEGAGHGMKSVTREVYAHVLNDEPQWLLDGLKAQLRDGSVMAATTPIVAQNDERPAHADLSI